MVNREIINSVIEFIHTHKEQEHDPVEYARLDETIWTLQDLRLKLTKIKSN